MGKGMSAIEKSCGSCGREFTCGQYGCWCGTVTVTDAQYDWILGHFQDCLCPACLEKVSSGAIGPLVKRPFV
jgi:hypothetical protein